MRSYATKAIRPQLLQNPGSAELGNICDHELEG